MTVNPLKIQEKECAICIQEKDSKESINAKDDNRYSLMIYIAMLLIYGLGTLKSDVIIGSIALIQAVVGLIARVNYFHPIFPFLLSLIVTQSVTFYGIFKYLTHNTGSDFYVMWALLQVYTMLLTFETGMQVLT